MKRRSREAWGTWTPASRARQARYKKKIWTHWRSYGLCGRCGKPAGVHRTGKRKGQPYAECFKHRRKTAKRSLQYMRSKRNYPRKRTQYPERDSRGRFLKCSSSSQSEMA